MKPTKIQKDFVKLVKKARRQEVTLEAMALAMATSMSSLSRWARGESIPSRNTVTRLAPILEELVAKAS